MVELGLGVSNLGSEESRRDLPEAQCRFSTSTCVLGPVFKVLSQETQVKAPCPQGSAPLGRRMQMSRTRVSWLAPCTGCGAAGGGRVEWGKLLGGGGALRQDSGEEGWTQDPPHLDRDMKTYL